MDTRIWHKSYDEGIPADLAFEDATLVDFLERAARAHGDRPALIYFNAKLTYRELLDQVRRCATALARLGVVKESRVAIQVPNTPQFVIAYYGTLMAGGIPVPTNPLYTPREIEHQWNDAGCTVAVVADFIYAQRIPGIRNKLGIKQYVIASIPEYMRFPLNLLAPLKLKKQTPPLIARVEPGPDVHHFRKLVEGTDPAPPTVTIGMNDVATLLYTGGTTGVSKGTMLTQRNLSCNVQQLRAWFPKGVVEDGREVVLGALPFFHSYGLTVVLNHGIRAAAAIVLMPNPRDIAGIIKATKKHKITLLPGVPAHYVAISQTPGVTKDDLRTVKFCNTGSAPLAVDVIERFEALTGATIIEGYGLTETSPVTHLNPIGKRKVGSIGVPAPSTDVRVVDVETGERDLPLGETGELLIKGPQVMKGYWNRPDEAAKALRGGWLYTGDLARIDDEGYHYIEGRKKDMIICSGYNVYPDEIDRVLMGHDAVLEAASIGIPHEKRGETVKSFVVLKPGRQATVEEIVAYCRENLAAYKVPQYIEFRSELPKSSVLKILRRELREEELQKLAAAASGHKRP